MLEMEARADAVEVSGLLEGAAKTMRSARYCWLATVAETSAPRIRPMGRVLNDPGEDEWKIRFLTDGRSRKAIEMRRAGGVSILFQHDPDLAYVNLMGKAVLHENASERRNHWKPAYDVYFPSEAERKSAIFVEVEVERMELWIRGVTPEPFGLRTTVLERDVEGWRLIGQDFGAKGRTGATRALCRRRTRPAFRAECADRRAPIDAVARRVPRA
jgi:general stress protein 26